MAFNRFGVIVDCEAGGLAFVFSPPDPSVSMLTLAGIQVSKVILKNGDAAIAARGGGGVLVLKSCRFENATSSAVGLLATSATFFQGGGAMSLYDMRWIRIKNTTFLNCEAMQV